MLSTIPDKFKNEVRNVLQTNIAFVGSHSDVPDAIQDILNRYYGRGDLYVVFIDGFELISEVINAFSTEMIFRLTINNVKNRKITESKVVTFSCVITVEPDEKNSFRENISCSIITDDLRDSENETLYFELEEEAQKLEREPKSTIYLG